MKTKILPLCTLLLLFSSCVTTGSIESSSFVSSTNIQHNINKWVIDFKYDNLTVELKKDKNGEIEETTKNYGQSDIGLIFLDELYHTLKMQHNIDVFKENSSTDEKIGKILIHPVIIPATGYYNYMVEISILNENNELIARSLVQKHDYASVGITNIIKECVDYIISIL